MSNEYVIRATETEENRIRLAVLERIVMSLPGAKDVDWESISAEVRGSLKAPISENFGPESQASLVGKVVSELQGR